jgi:plastin-1
MEQKEEKKSAKQEYEVDYQVQKEFNPVEFQEYQRAFAAFDAEKSGNIAKHQMHEVVKSLGHQGEDAEKLLEEANKHDKEHLGFEDFLKLFGKLKTSSDREAFQDKVGKVLHRIGQDTHAGYHTYELEERAAFANIINLHLGHDPDLARLLPINPENDDLFKACTSGVLLCKLINAAVPGTIYERAINKSANLNIFQTKENLNLALNAARGIGCKVISIFPESIIEMKEHLILGLLWQIIRILILVNLDLKVTPELAILLNEGEELATLLKQSPEELLMRWFNYHLKRAGHHREVKNFSGDVLDSELYTVLLSQLEPSQCDRSPLGESDLTIRAGLVINNAKRIGVDTFTAPHDIVSGNAKLNMLFTASIFNTKHGLTLTEEEKQAVEQLVYDDVEGTREERCFRMWINSLNIENLYINNLYVEVQDGLTLLKILDKVEPGSVNWKKVEKNPNHRLKKISNCALVVEIGQAIGFSLVGIGGMDFVDGNRKLILGYVWQLVRHASLKLVGGRSDDELLNWGKARVPHPRGNCTKPTSFRDKSLSNSLFLIELYASIDQRSVNWEIVNAGESAEDKEQNAKYVISLGRKLGASVFCVWEDIVEVKPKMIMTLFAAAAQLVSIKVGVEEVKEP